MRRGVKREANVEDEAGHRRLTFLDVHPHLQLIGYQWRVCGQEIRDI